MVLYQRWRIHAFYLYCMFSLRMFCVSCSEKGHEADIVLNPTMLESPECTNNYLDMLNNVKPSTPKARRKLVRI